MCCPLDRQTGRINYQISPPNEDNKEDNKYVITVFYCPRPNTLADRISRLFQKIELLEKIAECVDEACHLLGSTFQTHARLSKALYDCHDNAHQIEHVLHSFCFLGDLSRLWCGRFFVYHPCEEKEKQIDWRHSAARICHAVAHMLTTLKFFNEHRLIPFARLEKLGKLATLFSVSGFAITVLSMWQQRRPHCSSEAATWSSDFRIHLTGLLFSTHLCLQAAGIKSYATIHKLAALCGIIHASSIVNRLLPSDDIKLETTITI